MSVSNWCVRLSAIILLVVACSPAEPENSTQTSTPDQIIEQLQESYLEQNIVDYTYCFADSFMFVLHELDWGWNPNDPDSCWFLATDLAYTELLLQEATGISLELECTATYAWPDDSTALGMNCPFDLEVFTDSTQSNGYRANGNAVFRFVEISDDVWKIDYWKDQSDIGGAKEASTWGYIKYAFN